MCVCVCSHTPVIFVGWQVGQQSMSGIIMAVVLIIRFQDIGANSSARFISIAGLVTFSLHLVIPIGVLWKQTTV